MKNLLKCLFILLTFAFPNNIVHGQNVALPEKIDLAQYLSQGDSAFIANGNVRYGFPDVRIWGWADSGKVAYSIDRIVEGRGGYFSQFVIFDFVSDTIDFRIDFDSEDYIDSEDYNYSDPEKDIQYIYNQHKENISKALDKYKIIAKKNNFLPLPIKIKSTEYSCRLDLEQYVETEYFNREEVGKYKVVVGKNNKSKIVTETSTRGTETLYVYLCGYFLSPSGDRALIAVAEERWGFEGTELYYKFFGCHLERGFN